MLDQQHWVEAHERYAKGEVKAQLTAQIGQLSVYNPYLLSFGGRIKRLKAHQQIEQGLQLVPLDRIVGSIARYRNLARTFLLRTPINQDRWTRLKAARNPLESHQPVVLFKISEAYFVCDGNQRVSAARANGVSYIEAYVTEIKTAIPLTLHDFEHDEWRIKAQYVDF